MILSDISVRRPVFATVLSLLLVILGLAALRGLPVRQYPDIDPPLFRNAGVPIEKTLLTAPPNFLVELVNPNASGAIWYTTDGADPRGSPTLAAPTASTVPAKSTPVRTSSGVPIPESRRIKDGEPRI